MTEQIILTALEGMSLLVADCAQLRTVLAQLRAKGVPVIAFTERDRAELAPIRQQLDWVDPFITESGSGIFTPVNHNPFELAPGEREGDYYVQALGCPYVQARAGLRVMANMISHPLKGFGDLTVEQLQRAAGLSQEAAHQAKAREFSEPFMTPQAVAADVVLQAAQEIGFRVIVRSPEESRFSELLGAGAGLGSAAAQVIAAYQSQLPPGKTLKVLGISNQAEALTALAECHDSMVWTGTVVSDPSPSGWISAVQPLLQ
ncbi:hypothetical protein BH23CYA1_BH23CYA1_13390 [soil metagenome]